MVPLLRLQVNQSSAILRRAAADIFVAAGTPILVQAVASLTAHRGRLLTGEKQGTPVHAASFIRQRRIVLESELLRTPSAAQSILLHELFHFVWMRLGNPYRRSFTDLMDREVDGRALGEAGESSTVAKYRWKCHPCKTLWTNYVCEAFCDSGASVYLSRSPSPTLAGKWLSRRRSWFLQHRPPGGWRC